MSCSGQVAKDGCNGHPCRCLGRHITLGENVALNVGHIRPLFFYWSKSAICHHVISWVLFKDGVEV